MMECISIIPLEKGVVGLLAFTIITGLSLVTKVPLPMILYRGQTHVSVYHELFNNIGETWNINKYSFKICCTAGRTGTDTHRTYRDNTQRRHEAKRLSQISYIADKARGGTLSPAAAAPA